MSLYTHVRNRFRTLATILAATAVAVAGLGLSAAGPAQALDYGSLQLDQATSVGIHNTYDNSSYPYLADAQARVAELAADSVSFVSTDWSNSPGDGVLSEVLPRG